MDNRRRWFKVIGSKDNPLFDESALVFELGSEIYEAEPQGDITISGNRLTCSQFRLLRKMNWNERICRLFACDCAAHVLGIFERWRSNEPRPRQAIDVARRYADGKASADELSVAWNGARDAASGKKYKEPSYTDFIAYIAARAASDTALPNIQWGIPVLDFAAAARSGATQDKKGTTLNQSIAWIDERAYQTGKLMNYLESDNG